MPGRDEERFRREFLSEAESILEQANEAFARLEAPGDEPPPETVNALFRSIHSLKGIAGMAGLPGLSEAAHALEDLLDALRLGRVPFDDETAAAVRAALNGLGVLAERVASGEANPEPPVGSLDALNRAATRRPGEEGAALPPLQLPEGLASALTDYERHRLDENRRRGKRLLILPLELSMETFDEGLRRGMAGASESGELIGTFPGSSPSPAAMCFRLLVAVPGDASPAEVAARSGAASFERVDVDAEPKPPAEPPLEERLSRLGGTVRVPLAKINDLLDVAGTLGLARSALKRSLERVLLSPGDRTARHDAQKAFTLLDRTVTALGRSALAMRLVPVDQLTTRLTRAARSIALSLGKEVELTVIGGETEIDKVLADELQDPLLHLVRNALDHGIEPPDERLASGKERLGHVTLTAAARGRDVVFTLADDGRGMDPDEILARARERGLLLPSEPVPADPFGPIFRPGFSTASGVSQISGRGVGLDVVRSNIAAVKGSVSVRSEKGAGTVFEVVVPMTLALVESLLVRAGGRFFAFPTSGIERTFRSGEAPVEPFPLVRLDDLLGLTPEPAGLDDAVVVAGIGPRRAGFLVSAIEGMQDVVVKLLPGEVRRAPEITGTAQLPDGDLALTLDTGLLLERATGDRT